VIYIGIDPDLHHTGICAINGNRFNFAVAKVLAKFNGEEANARMGKSIWDMLHATLKAHRPEEITCIIESQMVYPGSKVPPNDIVMLAQAAGVAAGVLNTYTDNISLIKPTDWKGTQKKEACTQMILDHFKIPVGSLGKHESHIVDALGLACWGILRDQLPRAPDRDPDSRILGSALTKQRLARLPLLTIQGIPTRA